MNPSSKTVTIEGPGGIKGWKTLDDNAQLNARDNELTTSKVLSQTKTYLIDGKKAHVKFTEGPQPKDKRVYTVLWQ